MTLRLHIDLPDDPLAPLEFPRRALDQARQVAQTGAKRSVSAVKKRVEPMVAKIEAELEKMQRRVDSLHEDVHHYRFPVFTEFDPDSAA